MAVRLPADPDYLVRRKLPKSEGSLPAPRLIRKPLPTLRTSPQSRARNTIPEPLVEMTRDLIRAQGFAEPRFVADFQEAKGLKIDGVIGPKTMMAALQGSGDASSPTTQTAPSLAPSFGRETERSSPPLRQLAQAARTPGPAQRQDTIKYQDRVAGPDGKLYNSYHPSFHHYEYETPIGDFTPQLVEAAFRSLLKHAAPGQTAMSRTGQSVEAVAPLYGSLGLVDQVVDTATLSVTNHTQKDHELYPGSVRRSVIVKDGKVSVKTVGEGIGIGGGLNEFFAPVVWESADNPIWEEARRSKEHVEFRKLYPELLGRHGDPGFAPYGIGPAR